MFIQESPAKYWRTPSAAGVPRRRESVIRGAAREVALRQKEADRGWQPICDWGPAQRVLEGRPESIKGMP
jgi:hypothetical protein